MEVVEGFLVGLVVVRVVHRCVVDVVTSEVGYDGGCEDVVGRDVKVGGHHNDVGAGVVVEELPWVGAQGHVDVDDET